MLVVLTEKSLAYFTHRLLAVGEKVRQDLLLAGIGSKEKFGLMPPGLEISKLPQKNDSQIRLGVSVSRLQCAFIGRVTQIKRPDRFLDVVAEVKRRNLDLEFFMAGEGDLSEYCRERIQLEKLPVHLLGWQTNIETVLSAADIVLLTSDNEGTPLSLIQAGMAGLPVVTTNVGSVPEVVLDSTTGIVTSLNVQDLADAIEKLFEDRALRERLGSAAQHFTLANFGVNRLVRDHEQLYKSLVSNLAKS
jgi:glycosyltransferase involved in cell wall biosynthesis